MWQSKVFSKCVYFLLSFQSLKSKPQRWRTGTGTLRKRPKRVNHFFNEADSLRDQEWCVRGQTNGRNRKNDGLPFDGGYVTASTTREKKWRNQKRLKQNKRRASRWTLSFVFHGLFFSCLYSWIYLLRIEQQRHVQQKAQWLLFEDYIPYLPRWSTFGKVHPTSTKGKDDKEIIADETTSETHRLHFTWFAVEHFFTNICKTFQNSSFGEKFEVPISSIDIVYSYIYLMVYLCT